MGLHVYGIMPSRRAPPEVVRGVDDAPVFLVDAGGLGVWASSHDDAPVASIDSMRAHNAVLQAAMDAIVTPVPIRFGQWFPDAADVARRIGEERAHWDELLERFAGRAEYGAALSIRDPDAARDVRRPAESTGTAYMQQLARRQTEETARRQLAERIAEEITERLTGIEVETRLETPPRGAVIARVAHLVAWTEADSYHGAMREVRGFREGVQLHLTGPWPPWSFT